MNTYTKQQWIAEQARGRPERVFASLHHLIDDERIREAYRRTRKDGSTGIDGVTAADCENELEANLDDLLGRMTSGRYLAPPVRRHDIPKADGKQRPLRVPTLEEKVARRAILMLLEPIYETNFLPCSQGFRPGRPAHDALNAVRKVIIEQRQRWVIDADLKSYFDSIWHTHPRSFLDLRIKVGLAKMPLCGWSRGRCSQGQSRSSAARRADANRRFHPERCELHPVQPAANQAPARASSQSGNDASAVRVGV